MKYPPVKNLNQLEKLLTIRDLSQESIYGVIGRMEVLIEYFNQPGLLGFLSFLRTYYYVTRASAEKYLFYRHFFGV